MIATVWQCSGGSAEPSATIASLGGRTGWPADARSASCCDWSVCAACAAACACAAASACGAAALTAPPPPPRLRLAVGRRAAQLQRAPVVRERVERAEHPDDPHQLQPERLVVAVDA